MKSLPLHAVWLCILVPVHMLFFAAWAGAGYHAPRDRIPWYGDGDSLRDVIDIQRVESGLIGVVQGRRIYRLELDLRERVVWQQTKGVVGAVLTSERFLAISRASLGWAETHLKIEETNQLDRITSRISDHLALLVTPRRILGFDSRSGQILEQAFPLHDRVVDSAIDSHVAAVITDKRIYGLSRGRGVFLEKNLQGNETIRSVSTRSHSVTVRTSRRVLIFRSGGGGWRQFEND